MTIESLAQAALSATDAYETALQSASDLRARLERDGAQWSVAEFATQTTRCEQLELRVAQTRQARDSANKTLDAARALEAEQLCRDILTRDYERKTRELNECHAGLQEMQREIERLQTQITLEARRHSTLCSAVADLKTEIGAL